MAILVQLIFRSATQDQFNELDLLVDRSMMEAGGPPAGMMSHVVYPDADGFIVANVWATESEGRSFADDVLGPLATEVGLGSPESSLRSVWSFARP